MRGWKKFFENASRYLSALDPIRRFKDTIERYVLEEIRRREEDTTEDHRCYVRLKQVLTEKGLQDARMVLDLYDAHFIRTGKVHPLLLQGESLTPKAST